METSPKWWGAELTPLREDPHHGMHRECTVIHLALLVHVQIVHN